MPRRLPSCSATIDNGRSTPVDSPIPAGARCVRAFRRAAPAQQGAHRGAAGRKGRGSRLNAHILLRFRGLFCRSVASFMLSCFTATAFYPEERRPAKRVRLMPLEMTPT